ncbi:MAG: YfiR family protein [Gammaproteobacteria bacterium]|nr:YfiR family protein [Gammaproteobacteria bacterium]
MRARFVFAICVYAATISFCMAEPAQSQTALLEQQVKTSYLYNFIQFVAWPEDALNTGSKFNLCVLAGEEYGTTLTDLAAGQIDGHEIAVHRFDQFAGTDGLNCHLLFISREKFTLVPKDFNGERGMLTIGDMPGFLEHGGIINLVEVRGKIRFQINQQAAQRAGLTMSSKLLDLAMK